MNNVKQGRGGVNKPKVLLVDDEEPVRLAAQYVFAEWCDITTLETTAKALELLKTERYDLVILDMMIAGEGAESGLNALKIIYKEYPNLPVVVLTGTISWMQRSEELKQFGVIGYLIKPFGKEEARMIVENALKRKR